MPSPILDEYLYPLLAGNRIGCRNVLNNRLRMTENPTSLYYDLLWPAMERVDNLYRQDRINKVTESMASRINRFLADQLQRHLPTQEANGKRIIVLSAPGEPEELGAQMCSDLFESRGWEVYFIGSDVPNDEVQTLCGQLRPEILLIFGTQPQGAPAIRQLVDRIREIGINPTMNIMVSGGVYNRADGLWKEVGADLFAKNAREALAMAETAEQRVPEPPRTGPSKKRRRRRRPPLVTNADKN